MKKSRISFFIICVLFLCLFSCQTAVEKNTDQSGSLLTGPQAGTSAGFPDRIANRETPPVYKDWNNYPDIKGLDKFQLVAKLTVSWDSVEPKGESAKWGVYGTLLGLEWDRTTAQYPTLTKSLINLEQAKKNYDLVHKYNPNTMLGVEMRWDAIKDYELPPDHKWWKRDAKGERIGYSQSTPPRYEMNVTDPEYIAWVGERCQALLDSGVVDFILFDHIKYLSNHGGDPLPFLKGVRAVVGPNAIILGNTHFEQMAEAVKYIDAFGEKDESANALEALLFWENTGRKQPRFNCWEFIGKKDDFKGMRYYTTLVMTNTNASVRFIDHSGSTKPSPWYDFWDVKIGKFAGDKKIVNDCFAREYANGTTVCNNTDQVKKIGFNETRQRASNGEKAKEFSIESKDGDMFLYVK